MAAQLLINEWSQWWAGVEGEGGAESDHAGSFMFQMCSDIYLNLGRSVGLIFWLKGPAGGDLAAPNAKTAYCNNREPAAGSSFSAAVRELGRNGPCQSKSRWQFNLNDNARCYFLFRFIHANGTPLKCYAVRL